MVEELFPEIVGYFADAIASATPPDAPTAIRELGELFPEVGFGEFFRRREFVGACARYAYGEELWRRLTESSGWGNFRRRALDLAARTPWFEDSELPPEPPPPAFLSFPEPPAPCEVPPLWDVLFGRAPVRTVKIRRPPGKPIASHAGYAPPPPEPAVERYRPPESEGQKLLMPAIDVKAEVVADNGG